MFAENNAEIDVVNDDASNIAPDNLIIFRHNQKNEHWFLTRPASPQESLHCAWAWPPLPHTGIREYKVWCETKKPTAGRKKKYPWNYNWIRNWWGRMCEPRTTQSVLLIFVGIVVLGTWPQTTMDVAIYVFLFVQFVARPRCEHTHTHRTIDSIRPIIVFSLLFHRKYVWKNSIVTISFLRCNGRIERIVFFVVFACWECWKNGERTMEATLHIRPAVWTKSS